MRHVIRGRVSDEKIIMEMESTDDSGCCRDCENCPLAELDCDGECAGCPCMGRCEEDEDEYDEDI